MLSLEKRLRSFSNISTDHKLISCNLLLREVSELLSVQRDVTQQKEIRMEKESEDCNPNKISCISGSNSEALPLEFSKDLAPPS